MIVLIHVVIAMSSIVLATVGLFKPSKTKLRINYALITMTVVSGTIVCLTYHAGLLKACSDGLIYLAVVMSGVLVTNRRLAKATNK
jgi:hypothetical protein